jgi:hypothetical protein
MRREEAMSYDDPLLHQIASRIRKSGAFLGLDDDCIRSIAEAATWFSVRGGNSCFPRATRRRRCTSR